MGAVGDLQGDGFGGGLSDALQRLTQPTSKSFPTALIAGVVNSANLQGLTTSPDTNAIFLLCAASLEFDPLVQALSPNGLPTIFGQPSDAIVPLASQLNNLQPNDGFLFFGYVHSDGAERLGFAGPSVLVDPLNRVSNKVIELLNTPVSDPIFK